LEIRERIKDVFGDTKLPLNSNESNNYSSGIIGIQIMYFDTFTNFFIFFNELID